MRRSPLKKQRLQLGLTQQEVASKLGISQPNYHRWETGTAQVPKAQLKRLARVLRVTPDELLDKPKPFDYWGTDEGAEDERKYFGELALHFAGGSYPLLLPISELSRRLTYRQLSGDSLFIVVVTLDNRTVLIRRSAIADAYFSSEAYDDYGPDEYDNGGHLGVFPDDVFWHIAEYLYELHLLDEEYESEEIENVVRLIHAYQPEEVEAAEDTFYSRANNVEWRLTSGRVGRAAVDREELMESFGRYHLVPEIAADMAMDNYREDEDEHFLHLPVDGGYHRSVLINVSNLDWISLPTHKWRETTLDEAEREVDSQPAQAPRLDGLSKQISFDRDHSGMT